jgi:hypothetical protein
MKLAILIGLFILEVVSAQFGRSGSCDFRRLQQVVQQKEQCFEELMSLKKEMMDAIQRVDPSCNRKIMQSWQACEQPSKDFAEQNDLTPSAIMECCFGSRMGSFNSRQCDFQSRPMPDMGHGEGGKGHGKGKGMKGRGGKGGGMDMEQMEEMMKSSKTMADCAIMGMQEVLGMFSHMTWCMDEERPLSMSAINGPYRQYKDRLTAKVWECETPMIEVATNCTDVPYQDLECVKKGIMFGGMYKWGCMKACCPDGLPAMCNIFTGGRGANNNNNFFDPFGTK